MRGILSIVIASITLLSSPASAEWVRVQTDADNAIYSVDVDSIEGSGRFRYFWSNIVYAKPHTESGQLAYSATYYLSIDCQQKLFRLRFARFLDENNKTIQDYDYGESSGLGKPFPGSSEEASINFVCSRR